MSITKKLSVLYVVNNKICGKWASDDGDVDVCLSIAIREIRLMDAVL